MQKYVDMFTALGIFQRNIEDLPNDLRKDGLHIKEQSKKLHEYNEELAKSGIDFRSYVDQISGAYTEAYQALCKAYAYHSMLNSEIRRQKEDLINVIGEANAAS